MQERNALRCQGSGNQKPLPQKACFARFFSAAHMHLVPGSRIVVGFQRVDRLGRIVKPQEIRIAHGISAEDGAHVKGHAEIAGQITLVILAVITGLAFGNVAERVIEMTDARHPVLVVDTRLLIFAQRGRHIPSLTVDQHIRFDRACRPVDLIHCIHVENSHQVKAESVDVVQVHIEADDIQIQLPHHRAQAVEVIAAIASVGEPSLVGIAEIVIRNDPVKRGLCDVIHMIEYDIKRYPQTAGMHGRNHFS